MWVDCVAVAPCGCAVSWMGGEDGSETLLRVMQSWSRRGWHPEIHTATECQAMLQGTITGGCPKHSSVVMQTAMGI